MYVDMYELHSVTQHKTGKVYTEGDDVKQAQLNSTTQTTHHSTARTFIYTEGDISPKRGGSAPQVTLTHRLTLGAVNHLRTRICVM